jgi:hypothetical protein
MCFCCSGLGAAEDAYHHLQLAQKACSFQRPSLDLIVNSPVLVTVGALIPQPLMLCETSKFHCDSYSAFLTFLI